MFDERWYNDELVNESFAYRGNKCRTIQFRIRAVSYFSSKLVSNLKTLVEYRGHFFFFFILTSRFLHEVLRKKRVALLFTSSSVGFSPPDSYSPSLRFDYLFTLHQSVVQNLSDMRRYTFEIDATQLNLLRYRNHNRNHSSFVNSTSIRQDF